MKRGGDILHVMKRGGDIYMSRRTNDPEGGLVSDMEGSFIRGFCHTHSLQSQSHLVQ